MSKLTAPLN